MGVDAPDDVGRGASGRIRGRARTSSARRIATSSSVSVPPFVSHSTSVRRPGVAGGPERGQGVGGIVLVAVEVVLGVVDQLAAGAERQPNRVGDHRQVLLRRGAQDVADVEQPALAEDRDDRRLGGDQRREVRVRLGAVAAMAGRTECRQAGVLPGDRFGGLEEIHVLGVGARPAALDVGEPERVEPAGDLDLVRERDDQAFALRPVAKRRVVEDYPLLIRRPCGDRAEIEQCARLEGGDAPLGHRLRADLLQCRARRRRPRQDRQCGNRPRGHRRRPSRSPRPHWVGRATSAASWRRRGSWREDWRCPGRRCRARSRGSARTSHAGRRASAARRSRRTGSMPSEPASTLASSERMSPKRFSVTITSKAAGPLDEHHRAGVDQAMLDGRRPGSRP